MSAMDDDRQRSVRLARQIADLVVLTAGGVALALPLILPLG